MSYRDVRLFTSEKRPAQSTDHQEKTRGARGSSKRRPPYAVVTTRMLVQAQSMSRARGFSGSAAGPSFAQLQP